VAKFPSAYRGDAAGYKESRRQLGKTPAAGSELTPAEVPEPNTAAFLALEMFGVAAMQRFATINL
jgi:hypothetical protein